MSSRQLSRPMLPDPIVLNLTLPHLVWSHPMVSDPMLLHLMLSHLALSMR